MTLKDYLHYRGLESEILQQETVKDATFYRIFFKDPATSDYHCILKSNDREEKLTAIWTYLTQDESEEIFQGLVTGER